VECVKPSHSYTHRKTIEREEDRERERDRDREREREEANGVTMFKRTRKPQDLVKALKDALEKPNKKSEKAAEETSKCLSAICTFLYPTGDNVPSQEQIAVLAQEIYHVDVLTLLINNLGKLEFEAKKDAAQIFNSLLRRQIGTRAPTVEHLCQKEHIITSLVQGYTQNKEIALCCGLMLREAIKHEALAKMLLKEDNFNGFFEYVELATFDVASDAFSTFKLLLTKHKLLSAEFLLTNYDHFMKLYKKLLLSENYVTRRQSLKLLGELLLDRANYEVMRKYISDADNLRLMMNMLRDGSRNIEFEAFHVFKVFVANPEKPPIITGILLKNQKKLHDFLMNFQADRSDDEQFTEEKQYLIQQIMDLKAEE